MYNFMFKKVKQLELFIFVYETAPSNVNCSNINVWNGKRYTRYYIKIYLVIQWLYISSSLLRFVFNSRKVFSVMKKACNSRLSWFIMSRFSYKIQKTLKKTPMHSSRSICYIWYIWSVRSPSLRQVAQEPSQLATAATVPSIALKKIVRKSGIFFNQIFDNY